MLVKQLAKYILGHDRYVAFATTTKITIAMFLRFAYQRKRMKLCGLPANTSVKLFTDTAKQVCFGYYDVTPFSADETRLLAMHYPFPSNIQQPGKEISVGFYNLNQANSFQTIGKTSTWCWQQGCRLQWYADSNNLVLYNRMLDNCYGSVVQNIESSRIERKYRYPIYALSPNGVYGISLNFSRLHRLRPGYGYNVLPDVTAALAAPTNDGLWLVNMETGQGELLFSVAEIAAFEPHASMQNAIHYFNHVQWNPSSNRFLFFHVWLQNNQRFIRLITADADGSNRYALINEGHVSHYCWRSDATMIAYSTHQETGETYHLYTDRTQDMHAIDKNKFISDGHPTIAPNGKWLLTDTYPDKFREQSLIAYNLRASQITCLAKFFSPPRLTGEVRCDLHPRWSPMGNWICVDTAHNGKRELCLIHVAELINSFDAAK